MRPVRRNGLAGFIAVCALSTACATHAPAVRTPLPDLAAADADVRSGCYECLRSAQDRYSAAIADPRVGSEAAAGAFDASLLLALREKELGLAFESSLARARQLVERQADPALSANLVELAGAARGETAGIDPEARAEWLRARRGPPPRLDAALLPPEGQPFTSIATAYVWLTLECEHPQARRDVQASAVIARAGDSPLIRFRLAVCEMDSVDGFTRLRAEDERWAEATYFEGRLLASNPQTLTPAVSALRTAHDAIRHSPSITMVLADTERSAGEMTAALAHYDEVLSHVPAHRDALLGRTFALTQLERHEDGIASATRLIDLGTWHLGDAYYLRAWNEYQLKTLDAAWSDVERATSLRAGTEVFTLAGLVAYVRTDLDTARERFDRARKIDPSNCTAGQYLGVVQAEQGRWPDATPTFSAAMTCFRGAAAKARAELAQVEAADTTPEFKARQRAEHRKTIDDSELQAARCAYNAAQGFARLGRHGEALDHLAAAVERPELKEQAEALRRLIPPRQH